MQRPETAKGGAAMSKEIINLGEVENAIGVALQVLKVAEEVEFGLMFLYMTLRDHAHEYSKEQVAEFVNEGLASLLEGQYSLLAQARLGASKDIAVLEKFVEKEKEKVLAEA